MASPSIVWLRKDLRLADNPALQAAIRRGAPVVAVFILDTATEGALPVGSAAAWWLHHSLTALSDAIVALGGRLILRKGPARMVLPKLCNEVQAGAVFWNRCYEPAAIARDTDIKQTLKQNGIAVESFNGSLLYEPWQVERKSGGPFSVFTPFWKAECALGDPAPAHAAPTEISGVECDSDTLAGWSLLPSRPDWAAGFHDHWTPGEHGARERLNQFLDQTAARYEDTRNRPDIDGTSRLSPHLAFGEISPREIWHIARDRLRADPSGKAESGIWAFLRELGWRDFNHNLLYHNPALVTENHNHRFDDFPWQRDDAALAAWQRGQTGYPLVDAGMRELWQTGFMHNRVRMVCASFLVKHLLIDWRAGEAWFRDTLVDADLANNVANWQWVAGCGADAAPYFRIFNPIGQGEKFDPDGRYIRQWVPELADVPDKYLNQPWTLPGGQPVGYPAPVVDHKAARERALAAYQGTAKAQD